MDSGGWCLELPTFRRSNRSKSSFASTLLLLLVLASRSHIMSLSLPHSARQLVRIARQSHTRVIATASYPTSLAGPSSLTRPISTSSPTWKKATKTSGSKAAKAVSRQEVENIDYEDADLDKTLSKVAAQMEKAVNWAKSVVYESVERGRGRVSPCASLLYISLWDPS